MIDKHTLVEQVKRNNYNVMSLKEETERLQALCGIQAIKYEGGKVQSSLNPNRQTDLYNKYIEAKEKLEKEVLKAQNDRSILIEKLKELDEVSFTILYYRFMHNMSITRISEKINYSRAQTYRLYQIACEKFYK